MDREITKHRPFLRTIAPHIGAAIFLVVAQAALGSTQERATPKSDVIESGKFRIYIFKRPQFEENYPIARHGKSLILCDEILVCRS